MDVAKAVSRRGGIARTRELHGEGCSPASIASAVALGQVQRLRIGWFGLPALPELILDSHRAGGRPACVTVAALHGLWMLHKSNLHIEVAPHGYRFRAPVTAEVKGDGAQEVTVHWVDRPGSDRHGQPLSIALHHITRCLPELEAVCAVDSALNKKLVTLSELERLATGATRRILARCDACAESGVESIFRYRAEAAGFRFRTQVPIASGRVDFLFGDRLVVEVDGAEHHAGHSAFSADRDRDAWFAALGYFVLRFTYAQVVHRWHEIASVLTLLHRRGEQVWPARIRSSARLVE